MFVRLLRNALLLLPIAILIPGCKTTGTTATTTEALCTPWRAIEYSASGDSPKTVRQVRVHNATGANLKCWE